MESDKLIYQLVENSVGFAGDVFGENLRFNSEVLTNVLYDNIYRLLGDKIEEDDFAEWLADELLKNGYILKSTEQESEDKQTTEQKEEIVYAIDEKDHQELLDRIHAAIAVLKTNKTTVFKLFSDVEG